MVKILGVTYVYDLDKGTIYFDQRSCGILINDLNQQIYICHLQYYIQ